MKVIIIGADAAGMSAASQIKRRQPSWQVEAFEMGEYSSYALCGLPYYISGVIKEMKQLISISPEKFEKERGIKVHTNHKVLEILPKDKLIKVQNLKDQIISEHNYDRLLIATGAEPIIPENFPKDDKDGVFYLRGLNEAQAIKDYIKNKNVKKALVIGAGYIGLEMVEALRELGLETSLIGRAPAATFEPEFQGMVSEALNLSGVRFLKDQQAQNINFNSDGSIEVTTSIGKITTDLVIVGAGVKPRYELAEAAGLKLGVKKAISVSLKQKTSDPFIYAAGDCAESYNCLTKTQSYLPLALGANRQGKIAGINMSGGNALFPGVLGTAILKTFNLALAKTGLGLNEALSAGYMQAVKTIVTQKSKPGYYPGSAPVTVAIIYDKVSGKILGGQLASNVEGVGQRINTLVTAITAGLTIKDVSALDTAYAPPFSVVYDPIVMACQVASKS